MWTFKHRDILNLPFGWCAVTALGKFDPTLGGHLILWDLGIAVEFPAGSTILIPSATLTHSNLPVQQGEIRMSFTQYASGGLFRFVHNGFRTEKVFAAQDPQGFAEMNELKGNRWLESLNLFSTVDELLGK